MNFKEVFKNVIIIPCHHKSVLVLERYSVYFAFKLYVQWVMQVSNKIKLKLFNIVECKYKIHPALYMVQRFISRESRGLLTKTN